MSVRVDGDVIHLAGRCQAGDAEVLLVALQENAQRTVVIDKVERLHLAVAQILLAVRPAIRGTPDSAFLARHLVDLLQ